MSDMESDIITYRNFYHINYSSSFHRCYNISFFFQTQLQEVKLKENHLQTVVERGNNARNHGSMSDDDKKIIKQDIAMLENDFETLTQKIEERIKR